MGIAAAVQEKIACFFFSSVCLRCPSSVAERMCSPRRTFASAFISTVTTRGISVPSGRLESVKRAAPVRVMMGVMPAFEGRGCRAQQHGDIEHLPAADGDIAAVIFGKRILLVRGIVFLIDDDQADVRRRCENRRSAPDDHLRPAGGDRMPVLMPLGVLEPRMQNRHAGKASGEAPHRLGREGNLRHEHDGPLARRDDFLNRGCRVRFFPTPSRHESTARRSPRPAQAAFQFPPSPFPVRR